MTRSADSSAAHAEEARRILEGQLEAGERLLWSGQPHQGVRIGLTEVSVAALCLLAGGFAIYTQVHGPASRPLDASSVFFFFFWPLMFASSPLFDARRRRRIFYGVTDRRLLFVSGALRRRMKSLPIGAPLGLFLDPLPGGEATIAFGPTRFFGFAAPFRFERITDVETVYRTIREQEKHYWEARASGLSSG